MSKYDLIAIGDTTIDAFIALHEASVHCDLDKKNCVLCLSYADKVPYESLTVVPAVGNSSNVAVGSARLGLKSAILTAIGGDLHGGQVLSVYREEGVGRDLVKINHGRETNYHFVLTFRAERTILINHHDYDYFEPSRIGDAPWVSFSGSAPHWPENHRDYRRTERCLCFGRDEHLLSAALSRPETACRAHRSGGRLQYRFHERASPWIASE